MKRASSKKSSPHSVSQALRLVQKLYPTVNKISDGKDDVIVDVTSRDTASKAVKNHSACALAVACKRVLTLDGAIISKSVAYLVKDNQATRYLMQTSTSREVVAFDRGATFEPGEYQLKAPRKSSKLGQRQHGSRPGSSGPANGNMLSKRFRHVTQNVRSDLNSKDVV